MALAAGYGTGYAPAQPQAAVPEVGNAAQITVSGCVHTSVGPIIRGNYLVAGSNHNKPSFKKEHKVSGLDVMLYYWDERDGVAFSGWWFGPKIGGDQVWAYQPCRTTQTPPKGGWQVPYDGAVDATVVVSPKGVPASRAAFQPEVRQPQLQQHQMQQQRQLQQQQQVALMRQKAEESKKKLEEANKKRIEDEKRRIEEARKKAEEQKAVFSIRQALQKMKVANLSNFDQIHEEVAKVMEKELEKCGSLRSMIQTEHDKGWEQVKLRMEQLQLQKQKLQEQKKAAKEKAETFVKDLEGAVAAAEAAASVLKEAVDSLSEAEGLKLQQVNDMITSIDTATREANEAYQVCTELVRKNDVKGLDADAKDLKDQHSRLMQRMAACSMRKDTTIKSCTESKTEALRRAEAKEKFAKQMALFSKYDANKDGVLDKKEIANFAKKEHNFAVPDPAMVLLLKALIEDGAKGVKKENFQRLKVQIGVAREKVKDLQRRKLREEHEKEVAAMKEALTEKVEALLQRVQKAEESLQKVEEEAKVFKQGKDMKSLEMVKLADDLDVQIKAERESLEALKKDIAGVREGVDAEILSWFTAQARPVETKFKFLEPRLSALTTGSARFRESAKGKSRLELQQIEQSAEAMLRWHQKAKSLTPDEVADAFGGDAVTEAAFLEFFLSCEKDEANGSVPEADFARLFKHWDEDNEGTVSREALLCHIRRLMKVVRSAAMTETMSIKDSKIVRRLEEGEVVEALSAEQKDEETELMRLKVKALKDGAEGWVSLSGNQGTVFLKDGGQLFKVVKETILTEAFELDGVSAKEATRRLRDEPRKLKPGEMVEVRCWMKKEEKTGLMRMKCRTISDGAVGWATVVGNAGTRFLEVN